jgi:hypothetical protein
VSFAFVTLASCLPAVQVNVLLPYVRGLPIASYVIEPTPDTNVTLSFHVLSKVIKPKSNLSAELVE